jgi:hypothetical protein
MATYLLPIGQVFADNASTILSQSAFTIEDGTALRVDGAGAARPT